MGFNNPLSAAQLATAIASQTLTVNGQPIATAIAGQTLNVAGQPIATAIAAQTLTVSGQVTTLNPSGSDEDVVRALDQAAIDALTASDKSTNYVIYNLTTNALNYVVNGAIKIPGGAPVKTGLIAMSGSMAAGFTAVSFQLPTGMQSVEFTVGPVGTLGLGFRALCTSDATRTQVSAWNRAEATLASFGLTTTTDVLFWSYRDINGSFFNAQVRNIRYTPSTGLLAMEWGETAQNRSWGSGQSLVWLGS